MSKKELLLELLRKNNGILKTSDALRNEISNSYFLNFVKESGLEKISQGVYISSDAWSDEMYALQARFKKAIFSHETALYFLDMAEREPLQPSVTVPRGYNSSALREIAKTYTVSSELYEIGIIELTSNAGNPVTTYNAERTICDILRSRSSIEIQDFQVALKEYSKRKDRNLPQLMRYAKEFRVERILRPYLGVLI